MNKAVSDQTPYSVHFPLTAGQCLAIRNAFGPAKRKRQASKIEKFVSQAAAYRTLFGDVTRERPREVKDQLAHAVRASSRMVNALSALGEEARERIRDAGMALEKRALLDSREGEKLKNRSKNKNRRAPAVAKIVVEESGISGAHPGLDQLELNTHLLERDIAYAANIFKVTQGTRLKEIVAADVASDIFVMWFDVFEQKGSLVPGLEFHKVASAVANLFGLKIGSKTLKKADDGRVAEVLAKGNTRKI